MNDARYTFHETIAEIAALTQPCCDEGSTFHFSVEHLAKRQVCFQFRGRNRNGRFEVVGHRLDVNRGDLTFLPGHLVVAAMADFEDNAVMAFYIGKCSSIGTITGEVLARLGMSPEVLLIEIVTGQSDDLSASNSLSRLALIGLEGTKGWSPLRAASDILTLDGLLHPYWCRNRCVVIGGPKFSLNR
ncbi:hypothetical protein [Rhizobium indicum]|uniref:Uncharacterized protein n=1 Tax=Rhizobium indicum TaxID=2583231 RepID=A0ABX6PPC3_9HYPH|nr:hypothetical protein [Rhizobium indicum]QKK20460.1 hypothetical protein FFM53_029185 [Rhizobium indicum]